MGERYYMKAELNLDLNELAAAITQQVLKEIRPLLSQAKADDDPIWDIKSLAKYLDVKDTWVYQKIHTREIPYFKIGKYPRFRKSKIDEWLNETTQGNGKKQ